jgi:hypothetical protein
MGTSHAVAPVIESACDVASLTELAAGRRRATRRPPRFSPFALRCVSSGYMAGERSCAAAVPAAVAAAAWEHEQRRHPGEDRMFHFTFRGQQWLGFGVCEGEVRGVFCPEHDARRAEHYYAHRAVGSTSC